MANDHTAILDVQLDTYGVEQGVSVIAVALSGLQQVAGDVSADIMQSFAPLSDSLANMESGIYDLTDALNAVTQTLGSMVDLLEQQQAQQADGQWLEGLSVAIAGISMVIDGLSLAKEAGAGIIGSLGGAFDSLGKILGITGSAVAAIGVAIVAVIALIIAHWDEISLFFTETLPQLWEDFVSWIGGILDSVVQIVGNVVSAVVGFLTSIWDQAVGLFGSVVQWVQETIVQPIQEVWAAVAAWFGELFGSIWTTISDVFYNIGVIASGCWQIIQRAWELASGWFRDHVIQPVSNFFTTLWTGIATWASQAWSRICAIFQGVGAWFSANIIQPVTRLFTSLWQFFSTAASNAWAAVQSVFSTVAKFFHDTFSKAWQGIVKVFSIAGEIFSNIKDGILNAFRAIVNGIIRGLNTVISIPFNGINSALMRIRNISILGLTPFSGLRTIGVPQIPLLAQGAVLPANRPFLALLGDQTHGTNVEAPLATIQEAVANVMGDQLAAMLAGFEAVVQAIREKDTSVTIGDEVIGRAAARYQGKMAVMRGGI